MRAFIKVSSVAPGGGPAGYVYNLLEGNASLTEPVDYHGFPEPLQHRQAHRARPPGNRLEIQVRASARKVRSRLLPRIRQEARDAEQSNAIIVHGFQHIEHLLRSARRLSPLIYMPHSPVPFAQEQEMYASSLRGKKIRLDSFRKQEQAIFDAADYIVFPSGGAASCYSDFNFRSEKVRYVATGGPDLRITAGDDPELAQYKPYILFLGRYVEHKGYDIFNHLAARASRSGLKEFTFLSAGGGPLKPTENVVDLGWQTDPGALIRSASAVVIPSSRAYYDLLPIEVASLDRPILFSDVGGNRDQQLLLPNSRIFRSGDTQDAILNLRVLLERSNAYQGGNRSAYIRHMTLERFARSWAQLLQSV